MPENRIQDWIRYVQEKAENVAENDGASTRTDAESEDAAPPQTSREETAETAAMSGAQAAEKRVAASLRARRIASLRVETTEAAPPTQDANTEDSRAGENNAGGEIVVKSPATAPVPRRRIRPETRAQMLDRLTNPTISLHEASVILGVCSATVRRLTDAGTLPHERTTGGQRRFRLAEVMKLYRARHGEKSSK